MLEAVLFDLDDTLLENGMEQFLPQYLEGLSRHVEPWMPKELFQPALLRGVRAMMECEDAARSNQQVFWASFEASGGMSRSDFEVQLEAFYCQDYCALKELTRPVPLARTAVEMCLAKGLRVVIATNPLYPREGIYERLRWAQLDPAEYPFALVTSYENMHHTKPHVAYYREIAERIECAPERVLMIGNDEAMDITPAKALGMQTFQVQSASQRDAAAAEQSDADWLVLLELIAAQ